jgi:hypothetical protein
MFAEAAGEKPPPSLQIWADDGSPYAEVKAVLDAAQEARIVAASLKADATEVGGPPADVITFNDLSLPEAVLQLGIQAGMNIQFDPGILYRFACEGEETVSDVFWGRFELYPKYGERVAAKKRKRRKKRIYSASFALLRGYSFLSPDCLDRASENLRFAVGGEGVGFWGDSEYHF